MRIVLENTGRRFNRDWIFRHLDHEIATGSQALIVGRNGSGKSTLLQIISGFLSSSEGHVHRFLHSGKPLDDPALHMSLASPYLELHDQLTLEEAVQYQHTFRRFRGEKQVDEIIELSELTPHRNKRIRNFSSGMRQRLRLTLAIMADSELLCLDEPTSNLDKEAVQWYRKLLSEQLENRTVIVSSNHQPDDYLEAHTTIDLSVRS